MNVSRQRIPAAALLLTGALPAAAAWIYFHRLRDPATVTALYSATKLFTLLWPWLAAWVWEFPARPASVPSSGSRRPLLVGSAAGLAGAAGALLLYLGPLRQQAVDAAPAIAAKVEALRFESHFIVFALFLSFVHSLIEEIYWRWFLYGHLGARLTRHSAQIVAAIAFSAHHFFILAAFTTPFWTVLGGLIVALAGWVWCVLYRRTGSLLAPWVSHVLVDLAVLWVAWDLINRS